MANKRMFLKAIIQSVKFIKMPSSTQNLYFHLAMDADDEGIVEAFKIMRMINCSEDDLRILISKEFIKLLNEDMLTWIVDWDNHNSIRPERKTKSIYHDLLVKLLINSNTCQDVNQMSAECQQNVNQMSAECQQNVNQMSAECQQNVNQMSAECQHSIDKISIDKISIDKEKMSDNLPLKLEEIPFFNEEPSKKETRIDYLTIIVDYFNLRFNTKKYLGGSDRELISKYINLMFKNGDTLEDIKNLIDYKLASPNTQKKELTSWINTAYAAKNIIASKNWVSEGKVSIEKYDPNYIYQPHKDIHIKHAYIDTLSGNLCVWDSDNEDDKPDDVFCPIYTEDKINEFLKNRHSKLRYKDLPHFDTNTYSHPKYGRIDRIEGWQTWEGRNNV